MHSTEFHHIPAKLRNNMGHTSWQSRAVVCVCVCVCVCGTYMLQYALRGRLIEFRLACCG